jgi:peptide/nickel transport system permease protein
MVRASARTHWSGRLSPSLVVGLGMMLVLLLLAYIGPLFLNAEDAKVGGCAPKLRPSKANLLGTDTQGRDVFTVLVLAIPSTLEMGLIAGTVGLAIGTALGLLSGYFSGLVDNVISTSADVLMTIPRIAFLILVASYVRTVTVGLMGLIVASLAWMFPTRTVRSQTLSLRERPYVEMARLNGVEGVELIFREILPNLLPYLAGAFVMSVSQSILATVGLEALGLGPQNSFTLGMMIYWSVFYSAILRGMWWWWAPPIVVIIWIFVGLLFTSAGLDEVFNVKLREGAGV